MTKQNLNRAELKQHKHGAEVVIHFDVSLLDPARQKLFASSVIEGITLWEKFLTQMGDSQIAAMNLVQDRIKEEAKTTNN